MYKVECPHCDNEIEIDHIECDNWDQECPNCNETFEVEVEYTPELTARKLNMVKCLKCGKDFDKKYFCRYHPMLNGYKKDDNLCDDCYIKLLANSD